VSAAQELRAALASDRVMAILRYRSGGDVRAAVEGLASGGVHVVEVTTDTPGAWDADLRVPDGVLLGAGTVTSVDQVRRVAHRGARFVVSPGFDADVVAAAHDRGMAVLPGVATGTEVLAARRAGVEFFKLFPAGALGIDYLAQLRGPFGALDFVPTGGIAVEEVGAWLRAGAFAVALGSSLAGRCAPDGPADVAALTARASKALRGAYEETDQLRA
jgi:2-dehydro-3-deoxyphosphogluconate aldolase/(4S)-4-hydroxy-2-oxoglutarate aldolase